MPHRLSRHAIPYEISEQVTEAEYFHLSRLGQARRPLRVVYGGRERCQPTYRTDRATFPFFGIELVLEGRGQVSLDGRSHPLQAGSVFSYGPGVACRITTDPKHPLRKFFVEFAGSSARAFAGRLLIGLGGARTFPAFADLAWLFERLLDEGRKNLPTSPETCTAYLQLIALKLVEFGGLAPERQGAAWQHYERAHTLLEDNFLELRNLDDLASASGLDPSYLCRLFRRFHRASPYRALVEKKMQHGLQLLRNTSRPIRQIAENLGFPDPYHFSRLFKKIHGLAPSHFRAAKG